MLNRFGWILHLSGAEGGRPSRCSLILSMSQGEERLSAQDERWTTGGVCRSCIQVPRPCKSRQLPLERRFTDAVRGLSQAPRSVSKTEPCSNFCNKTRNSHPSNKPEINRGISRSSCHPLVQFFLRPSRNRIADGTSLLRTNPTTAPIGPEIKNPVIRKETTANAWMTDTVATT